MSASCSPATRRRVALLVAALAALAGCGGGDEGAGSSGSSGPSGASKVEVDLEPGLDKTIYCPGDGRCARIAAADFSPTPRGRACADVFGGKAKATVRGTAAGKEIDASFNLRNGCEIKRWEEFAWLLGDPPSAGS